MSNRQEVGHVTEVMVRAYGDEPVRLWAVNAGAGIVEAASEDRSVSMAFPAEDVFRFDDRLFGQLKTAYEKRSLARLKSLWSEAHCVAA